MTLWQWEGIENQELEQNMQSGNYEQGSYLIAPVPMPVTLPWAWAPLSLHQLSPSLFELDVMLQSHVDVV